MLAWVAAQPRDTLYTASICQTEILYGIALLPGGLRRDSLATAAGAMFAEDFAGRVLPYNAMAAVHYVDIVIRRRRIGKPIETFDALIAATARAAGFSIATRDAGGFEGCGLTIVNPWTAR